MLLKPSRFPLIFAALTTSAFAGGIPPEASLSTKVNPSAVLISRLEGNSALLNSLAIPGYARDSVKLKRLDRMNLQIGNLVYKVPGTLPSEPLGVGTQTAINCSDMDQQSSIQFTETKGNTITHEFSYGFTEGISAGFKVGLPGVGETEVTASVEFNQNVSNATSTSIETSWSLTVPTNVAAGKKQVGQLVVTNYVYDKIPFSAKAYAQGQALLSLEYWDQMRKMTVPYQQLINLNQFLDDNGLRFDLKGTLSGAISGTDANAQWGYTEPVTPADCGGGGKPGTGANASAAAGGGSHQGGKLVIRKEPASAPLLKAVASKAGTISGVRRVR